MVKALVVGPLVELFFGFPILILTEACHVHEHAEDEDEDNASHLVLSLSAGGHQIGVYIQPTIRD